MGIVTTSPVYLALDVGDVRIGLALSRSGILAEPLTTLTRSGKSQVLSDITAVVEREKVTVCVIGLPFLTSGIEGGQAEKTRAFGRSLARRLPALKIIFRDERYSSVMASDVIEANGRGGGKGRIDRLAAAIILQGYLDDSARSGPDFSGACSTPKQAGGKSELVGEKKSQNSGTPSP